MSDPRLAIVTGAANGIGRAVAERLGADGYRVLVADLEEEAGHEVAAGLPGSEFVRCDVSLPEELDRVAARALELGEGRIDALFNNAGMTSRTAFLDSTPETWAAIEQTNLQSVYLLTRACVGGLQAASGAVVSTSSVAGLVGVQGLAAYSATKAAIIALTRSLALELGAKIRINAICPGEIGTRMMARIMADGVLSAKSMERVPAGRFGRPEEVANVVAWLLSEEASYVNGVAIPVDGGLSAGYRDADE